MRHGRIRTTLISLITIFALIIPTVSFGTLLYGHPYACYYNREVGSANFDTGIVFLWNGMLYSGSARISSLHSGGFFAQGCWDTLRDAMYSKKFTAVWTDAGPHTDVNDFSQGELQILAVTIF